MDRKRKNYALVFKTDSDLTSEDESPIVQQVENLISNSSSGTFKFSKFELVARELAEMEKVIDGPFSIGPRDFNVETTEPTVFLYQHADVRFSDNLKVEHKNPRLIVFVSSLLPDRIKGILSSFNDAYRQLPQEGPGIICIEINPGFYRDSQELKRDVEILGRNMMGKLNVTKRVNAVILTLSSYIQEKERASYRVEVSSFKNSYPKNPLDNSFLDEMCKLKIR